jgi:hypothetical protein
MKGGNNSPSLSSLCRYYNTKIDELKRRVGSGDASSELGLGTWDPYEMVSPIFHALDD